MKPQALVTTWVASRSGLCWYSICLCRAVAGPFTRRQPNITLGCSGSRKFADIKDDEVIVGSPEKTLAVWSTH